MKLLLTNGYPYPYPDGLSQKADDALSDAAADVRFSLDNIASFEWKHTVTVGFTDDAAFDAAQEATGWPTWCERVLEAPTSSGDGYDHPAIIVKGKAYCGFLVYPE